MTPPAPELPAEFDHAIYTAHPGNADLHGLPPKEALHHYDTYGRAEGRPSSLVDGREAFLALMPDDAAVLEIGPSCRPCFAPGCRSVRTLDAFTTAELRQLAEQQGADPALVPEIDFVWEGQPYRELTRERFDIVVAALSLERQPCLLTHLTDVASLLRLGGRFFLILADRRFGTGHYVPDTTLADVLDAFVVRRIRHSMRSLFAERLMMTHDHTASHWAGRHGPDPRQRPADTSLRDEIAATMRAIRAASGYIDARAWYFTPDSFRNLIDTLATVGLSPFRVERVYPTLNPGNEFYAVLRVAA